MSQRHRFTKAVAHRRSVQTWFALSSGVLALALSGCSGQTTTTPPPPVPLSASAPSAQPTEAVPGQSRLVLGAPEPGLSFTVAPADKTAPGPEPVAGPSSRRSRAASASAASPAAAAAAFGDAVVAGRTVDAFALLTPASAHAQKAAKESDLFFKSDKILNISIDILDILYP